MSVGALRVVVQGIAFWSSRLPGWDVAREVIRGTQPPPQSMSPRPVPAVLAPTERRRAPDSVAIALEAAQRACMASGHAPQELAAVFASTHGDLGISDYMCATLAKTPLLVSPTKFHNSVHNAAAGYWSIGTGSHASYTALTAYLYTFAAGLFEAATQVVFDQRPVLYVAFDVEAKGPLAMITPSSGLLSVALVLAPAGQSGTHRLSLELTGHEHAPVSVASSPAAALVADNVLANCLPFYEALALETELPAAPIVLALSQHLRLAVSLEHRGTHGRWPGSAPP